MSIDAKLVAALKLAVPGMPVYALVAPQTDAVRALPYAMYQHLTDTKDSIICPGQEVWNFEIELQTVCKDYDTSNVLKNQIIAAVHAMPECQSPIDTTVGDYYDESGRNFGHLFNFSFKDLL